MLRNAKSLEGYELRARDGTIGRVKDIYFDDARWHARYFVVDTGMWLSGRSVLIASAALTARDWDSKALEVNLTQEQVEKSPSVDTAKPVSRQQEEELHRHYDWPYYWTAPMMGGAYMAPFGPGPAPIAAGLRPTHSSDQTDLGGARGARSMTDEPRQKPEGDPHLRSVHDVRGYHIEATDGSIGHVEDFVFDDENWAIRYMLLDTRNWWPGKKVIVSPSQIKDISWMDRSVFVNLSRDTIKAGPEFDEQQPLTADYTDRLDAHYGAFTRRRDP